MWLFLLFLFITILGAWGASSDPDLADYVCKHKYEYDGDSFTPDDKHYGRYYICSKCNKEHFISYKDWRDMRDIYPDKFKYWKNLPYTKRLTEQIERDNKNNKL